MVKRLATLVGCNYPNTKYELHGCINDVQAMQPVLINCFGFQLEDIVLLTDAPDSMIKPTGKKIKEELSKMINKAKRGDILFFHFSGHGVLIPSTGDGPKEEHEAIVPCDCNLIMGRMNENLEMFRDSDVDFRILVNRLPEGAFFIFFADSCHSGGLIDKEKEQIGTYNSDRELPRGNVPNASRKFIPISSIIDSLCPISGHPSVEPLEVHLIAAFGNEASAIFRLQSFQSHELQRLGPDNGILLSACRKDEKAFETQGPKVHGEFTYAVLQFLKAHLAPISNRDLVTRVREKLHEKGINQHPCLYCSDKNTELHFLLETARSNECTNFPSLLETASSSV